MTRTEKLPFPIHRVAADARPFQLKTMFHLEKITSLDLPELAPYHTMRRSVEHEAQGIFVAEGEKVVRRLLESRLKSCPCCCPKNIWTPFARCSTRARKISPSISRKENCSRRSSALRFIKACSPSEKFRRPWRWANLLANSPKPRLLVALDELSNAENLGAIARNAVAFGVQALIAGETCSSPFLRRAVRNSMGTIFQLPVLELKENAEGSPIEKIPDGSRGRSPPNFGAELRDLRTRGVRCIAAHPHADGRTLSQADFSAIAASFSAAKATAFPKRFGKLRRSGGDPDGERRGFAECRRGGGGFSLRGKPAAEENLNRRDAEAQRKKFLLSASLRLCG